MTLSPETLTFAEAIGFLRLRTDGRHEVADHRIPYELFTCPRGEWCILARGHDGQCCDDREEWAGPDRFYPAPSLLRERSMA